MAPRKKDPKAKPGQPGTASTAKLDEGARTAPKSGNPIHRLGEYAHPSKKKPKGR